MAKLISYEIRLRGEFMLEGKIVQAINHESTILLEPRDDHYADSIVIEIATGNWWLMLAEPEGIVSIDVTSPEIIHPYYRDPNKRVALAKACEDICQIGENILTSGSGNFKRQLKEYEKEGRDIELLYIEKRMAAEQNSIIKIAECLKESAILSTAIIVGDHEKARTAQQNANKLLKQARISSQASHLPSDIEPNQAEQSFTNAKILLAITNKQNKKIQENRNSKNKDKTIKKNNAIRKETNTESKVNILNIARAAELNSY